MTPCRKNCPRATIAALYLKYFRMACVLSFTSIILIVVSCEIVASKPCFKTISDGLNKYNMFLPKILFPLIMYMILSESMGLLRSSERTTLTESCAEEKTAEDNNIPRNKVLRILKSYLNRPMLQIL